MARQRIRTGIASLDDEWGGFPQGRTVLLTGDTGSGKTIFSLQFAYSSCAQGLRTAYISTEEDIEDLKDQAGAFDWGKDDWEAKGLLSFVDFSSKRMSEISTSIEISVDLQKGNFDSLFAAIPIYVQTVIIDSLGNQTAHLSVTEFKGRFDLLVHSLHRRDLNTLIVLDSAISTTYNDLALFSAYGALRLSKHDNPFTGQRERVMDVVKMRNTRTQLQPLVFKIDHQGISIVDTMESKTTKK